LGTLLVLLGGKEEPLNVTHKPIPSVTSGIVGKKTPGRRQRVACGRTEKSFWLRKIKKIRKKLKGSDGTWGWEAEVPKKRPAKKGNSEERRQQWRRGCCHELSRRTADGFRGMRKRRNYYRGSSNHKGERRNEKKGTESPGSQKRK